MAQKKSALESPDAAGQSGGALSLVADTVARRAGRRHVLALGVLTPLFAVLALMVGVNAP